MEILIFRNLDNPDELQKFIEFAVNHKIYRRAVIVNYTLNVKGRIFNLTYDPYKDLLSPLESIYIIRNLLGLNNDKEFREYLGTHANYSIENKLVDFEKPLPELNYYNAILFFLLINDEIVSYAYVTYYNYGSITFYINYVKSFIERKGYCRIICGEILKEARRMGSQSIKLASEGGLAGHKCYINSFLLSPNGYDSVSIDDTFYGGSIQTVLRKGNASEWLKRLPNAIDYDDSYSMEFFD